MSCGGVSYGCGSHILDAIDQLRKRKARPDLDRICHMLERRHGFKAPQVQQELASLVQEGVVVKVDYKGNTSYRNAAKWIKTKQQFSFYASSDISTNVLEAVRALTQRSQPNQPPKSASLQAIEQYLLKRDSQSNLNLATLQAVLEKEVELRHLHQLPNGEYVLLHATKVYLMTPEEKLAIDSKGAKTDADDNSSNSGEEQTVNRCDYCLFTAGANRKGDPEDLLLCKDCGAKAHPSCMEYTKLLYEKFPNPKEWQCPDCKNCVICEETNLSNDMITCYICFKGYHLKCHKPALPEKPPGTWLCYKCDVPKPVEKTPKPKPKYLPDSNRDKRSISPPFSEGFQKSIEEYPSSVPLAKKWSIGNVEEFFKFIGFEDEALAFREQEIDGLSLLLMKRNDVLTGLGIKLGPALKIYKHVVNLQSRIGDN